MGTDSDTLSLYIRASTDLQRSYAVAVDYVRSVALRNAITRIKDGDVDASKWWLRNDIVSLRLISLPPQLYLIPHGTPSH